VAGGFVWVGFDYLGESAGWPSKGWPNGLFDTCGFIKPVAFFHACHWKAEPQVYIRVLHDSLDADPGYPHWGWPKMAAHWNFEKFRGDILRVETPSNCETVELVLNGESRGRRRPSAYPNSTILWMIPFQPGKIEALGRIGDAVVSRSQLVTAGSPTQIGLKPDRRELRAGGQDLVHVEVNLLDQQGNLVPDADRQITFTIKGEGKLAGVDNGDLRCPESYKGNIRTTYGGRCLVIVQSSRSAGTIELNALSPGLTSAQLALASR
jgi:beta-galactosidase